MDWPSERIVNIRLSHGADATSILAYGGGTVCYIVSNVLSDTNDISVGDLRSQDLGPSGCTIADKIDTSKNLGVLWPFSSNWWQPYHACEEVWSAVLCNRLRCLGYIFIDYRLSVLHYRIFYKHIYINLYWAVTFRSDLMEEL